MDSTLFQWNLLCSRLRSCKETTKNKFIEIEKEKYCVYALEIKTEGVVRYVSEKKMSNQNHFPPTEIPCSCQLYISYSIRLELTSTHFNVSNLFINNMSGQWIWFCDVRSLLFFYGLHAHLPYHPLQYNRMILIFCSFVSVFVCVCVCVCASHWMIFYHLWIFGHALGIIER